MAPTNTTVTVSTAIYIPSRYAVQYKKNGAVIEQLLKPGFTIDTTTPIAAKIGRTNGLAVSSANGERFFVTKNRFVLVEQGWNVLLTKDGLFPESVEGAVESRARWMTSAPATALGAQAEDARNSWKDNVQLVEAQEGQDFSGLRSPQVGAVYAALAHWKTAEEPATVVMPTGTGKTETMLTLLVHQRCTRLIVTVPTDALRTQIADKFSSLGWLRRLGVLAPDSANPVVSRLMNSIKTVEQANAVFADCNVLVTTMNILHLCAEPAIQQLADLCSHLFIDEAHHISAPTWTQVKQVFLAKRIVQFTATPFRNDKKYVDGKVIFNYPLSKAQQEDYFKPINFFAINEWNPSIADRLIADKAVERLRADEQAGFTHLILARTQSIPRAEEVLLHYQQHTGLNPLLIHSKLKDPEKRALIADLRAGRSRVVVCVNMLGEGFDLPELKIAAIHDAHKSLAITLQFTGRFTRFRRDLGDASIVVNIADVEVQNELRELYAEDANWNHLLRQLSQGASGEQEHLSDFFRGFDPLPRFYSLQNVTPKMSTVVFETPADGWQPDKLAGFFKEEKLLDTPSINHAEKVAVIVVKQTEEVDWAAIRDLRNTAWDLYILYWDESKRLMYINSSVSKSKHEDLAKVLFNEPVTLKSGEQIFRVLDGITRLSLTNLGLSHVIGRAVRFTMFMGSDTLQGLSEASRQGKAKSNTFGFGYRDGGMVTAGGSMKGKVWSYKVAGTIAEWMKWCREVGDKLCDDTINVDQIFEHIVKYEALTGRPDAVPLTMAWSEDVMSRPESTIQFVINGSTSFMYEVGLRVTTGDSISPICFEVYTDAQVARYEIRFADGQMTYVALSGTVAVISGKSTYSLNEWLAKEPPVIYFHDRSVIQHNLIARITQAPAPYNAAGIETWDWSGINIRFESQGPARSTNTIQYKVIAELKNQDYSLIFDDDSSGEAADIVAVRESDGGLHVDLFHCKYSGEQNPGRRVSDLYEVCGQAQRSIHWYIDSWRLFKHLQHRETLRANSTTRFEVGDVTLLKTLEKRARQQRVTFAIIIVQPGLSRNLVSSDQLHLLAGTAAYLKETFELPLRVIASA